MLSIIISLIIDNIDRDDVNGRFHNLVLQMTYKIKRSQFTFLSVFRVVGKRKENLQKKLMDR
jgi:hypothetical protein